MTALPFFEMLRSRALWAGTLVLLALAAQIVTAQDNSQKIEPAVPGANVTEARTNLTGQMPEGNGAQSQKPPSSGNGRMVTGKVVFADTNAPTDLIQAQATFHSGVTFKMLDQLQQAKTLDERLAFFQSDEYQKAIANPREYAVKLSVDHSFKLAGVVPGNYEFDVQLVEESATTHAISTNIFTSLRKIVVPKAANTNGDIPLDLGTIELKQLTLPAFPPEPASK
ncbi:MAG TPA: hypothetical protein VIK53_05050 [Verrucomicrobiae bacterium]